MASDLIERFKGGDGIDQIPIDQFLAYVFECKFHGLTIQGLKQKYNLSADSALEFDLLYAQLALAQTAMDALSMFKHWKSVLYLMSDNDSNFNTFAKVRSALGL